MVSAPLAGTSAATKPQRRVGVTSIILAVLGVVFVVMAILVNTTAVGDSSSLASAR
jgi:hypothetical protein